jgi:serine/threonine protein kinase
MAAAQYPQRFGNYTLLKKIAQGGMAEIFLAQSQKDGRICALKRILPHLAHEEGFIRMFIDEARIVENLDHPNVAGIVDNGKVEGYYYLAMEYVEGHSLLALSERARSMKIPLPRGLLAFVIGELCAGLAHAHAARDSKGRHLAIVHRDVTPQNVMIGYDGAVKLIDFGVAKARARLTQTEAGFTKGKLSYMSPEQARGEELDGRSDLFSVGIILYEITTGHRLFNKEGPGGILSAIVNEPIPSPSTKTKNYPSDLDGIVMRALDKSVDRRWQSADDMRDALMKFAQREKPRPSSGRLADLVHDLFGDPEHKKLIDEAQAVVEVTPDQPIKAEIARGASVRIQGNKIPEFETEGNQDRSDVLRKGGETRMFPVSEQVAAVSRSVPKLEVTRDKLPVLSTPIEHEDAPVPEPKLPPRVRAAQLLTTLADDLRASWRAHRMRWILAAVALSVLVVGGTLQLLGVFGAAGELVGEAAERARELKKNAGLDPSSLPDVGLKPTVLRLVSEPPGALVTIDGIGAGCVTPCEPPNLPLGRDLDIELVLDGYRPRKETLRLRPNEGTREVSLALERAVGGLRIESDPPGASVWVDGKRLPGTTPLSLDNLRAGEQLRLEVKKGGFLPEARVELAPDGEVRTVAVTLRGDPGAIPPGRVDVTSRPDGCNVKIGGTFAGTTPISGFEVKAGTRDVVVECEYYAPYTETIEVEPGRVSKVEAVARAVVFGYLTVQVSPEKGSVVSINGRKIEGRVEFQKVVPGRHQIVVRNAGLDKTKTVTVDVPPDGRITRRVDLFQ